MSGIERYLERERARIDAALAAAFPVVAAPPHRLVEAVRYSLLRGGKRIRPVLVLAASAAVGGDRKRAMPYACAIEMIHAYSLVHDDLPAMDDDTLRRGQPTTHVAFDEATAILAGDALLTEAFHIMAQSAERDGQPRRALRVMREVAEAAGGRGMVGGQAADLAAQGQTPDLAMVELIHVRKTGALILAAVRAGGLIGGARAAALRSLTRYGECLGLAFQVADDILDAEAPTSVTGKSQGRDAELHKATYPAVLGLPAAKQRARELRDQAVAALERFDRRAEPLRAIARLVVGRAGEP